MSDQNLNLIKESIEERVKWIKEILVSAGAKGIVYGNSGGKDCTLVGALAKLATDNVLGVIMPCGSSVNYGSDREDALAAGRQFDILQTEVDLSSVKDVLLNALGGEFDSEKPLEGAVKAASANINPRIRMTVLYALAQKNGFLVAGTGNLDEITMGYFTKWGDGAYDFNPIADLTVEEIYDYLRYFNAPENIINKAPSAGLYEGQTDELELGVSYAHIDAYLKGKPVPAEAVNRIENAKFRNLHKQRMPLRYGENRLEN